MKTLIKKTRRLLALAIMLLFVAPSLRAETPLLVYDFNLGMPAVDNVDYLHSLGFRGVVTRVQKAGDLNKLVKYSQYVAQFDDFRLLAYVSYNFNDPASSNVWRQALPVLANSGSPLWVIVRNAPSNLALRQLLLEMAQDSEVQGVRTVIYPHWDTSIETAAEASTFIDTIGHPNLLNSLHTCHEIRGGNQYSLPSVVQAHVSETALVSVAGADENAYAGPFMPFVNWSDAIKPLDAGDYSLFPFIRALNESGYHGPVILQTFGIVGDPDHLKRSIRKYAEYTEHLVTNARAARARKN